MTDVSDAGNHLVRGHRDDPGCDCGPEKTDVFSSSREREMVALWHREGGQRIGAHAPDGHRAVTQMSREEYSRRVS